MKEIILVQKLRKVSQPERIRTMFFGKIVFTHHRVFEMQNSILFLDVVGAIDIAPLVAELFIRRTTNANTIWKRNQII